MTDAAEHLGLYSPAEAALAGLGSAGPGGAVVVQVGAELL